MSALKPHTSYQMSDSACFGQVPSHWSFHRLGQHFIERRETVSDEEYPPLSVTKAGIVPQLDTAAKTDNGDNRKGVIAGDFVINSRSDRKGSAGISDLDGSVSVISTVITPIDLDRKFVHHLLRSQPFQEEYYRFGSGIVADLWSTRYSSMKNIKLPIPPLSEQRAIASYLDHETAEIDAFIGDQEELVELLNERRAATITQAVTKGLSPNAPMKDSGISAIAPFPAHWLREKLSRLGISQESGTSVNGYSDPDDMIGVRVLKTGCASKGVFDPSENKKVIEDDLRRVTCPVRPGALIVNRANTPDLVGSSALVVGEYPELYLSDKLWQLDFSRSENRFMNWWMKTPAYRAQVKFHAVGASASMQNLSLSDFTSFAIALPPLSEQVEIADHLDFETAEIDSAIADAKEAIELSKERRTALISAVVTGKVDVRNHITSELGAA